MTQLSSTAPAVLAILLDSLADALPGPKPPRWQTDAERGLTAGQWRTCTTCHGEGTVKRRNHRVTCHVCHGRCGWMTDPYAVDGKAVAADSQGVSEMTLLDFWDTAQAVCDHSGAPGIERIERLYDRRLDSELADRARSKHPCFAHLEQALAVMRRNEFRYHWAVLVRSHLLGLPTADDHDGELYNDALEMLAITLDVVCAPRVFHAPQWARDAAAKPKPVNGKGRWANGHAQQQRDAKIHDLAARGMNDQTIADKMGLHRTTVVKIRNRAKEAA